MDKKTYHHKEKNEYLLAWSHLRKQSVKWGCRQRRCCSVYFQQTHWYREPSTLHTTPCNPSHAVHRASPPLVCFICPSPNSLPWLLLTLVYPDKAFMLKQFRALKKHLFYITTQEDLTQTAAACNQVSLKIFVLTQASNVGRGCGRKTTTGKWTPTGPPQTISLVNLLFFTETSGVNWRNLIYYVMWLIGSYRSTVNAKI